MDPSYRFPIFETSAAALCGNISTYCIRVSGRSCAIMPVILTEDIAPWIPEGVGVEPNPKKAHQDTLFGIFCLPCLQARREHENGETQASISESVAFGS